MSPQMMIQSEHLLRVYYAHWFRAVPVLFHFIFILIKLSFIFFHQWKQGSLEVYINILLNQFDANWLNLQVGPYYDLSSHNMNICLSNHFRTFES